MNIFQQCREDKKAEQSIEIAENWEKLENLKTSWNEDDKNAENKKKWADIVRRFQLSIFDNKMYILTSKIWII